MLDEMLDEMVVSFVRFEAACSGFGDGAAVMISPMGEKLWWGRDRCGSTLLHERPALSSP